MLMKVNRLLRINERKNQNQLLNINGVQQMLLFRSNNLNGCDTIKTAKCEIRQPNMRNSVKWRVLLNSSNHISFSTYDITKPCHFG